MIWRRLDGDWSFSAPQQNHLHLINLISSKVHPKRRGPVQPILAQRVRTHRPVADDDNTSLNITWAQLYLDDIRSENMNHAHQLIFWSCVMWLPCFRDHSLEEQVCCSGISYCFKVAWRLCGAGDDSRAPVWDLLTCSTVTCWGLFGRTELQYLCPW